MFCPKCGTKNPDNGKFCRSCGTDLNIVSDVLTGKLDIKRANKLVDRKGRTVSYESAFRKLFTGIALVGVTIALSVSQMGTGWWFWMLLPALACIGSGLAQLMQIKASDKTNTNFISTESERELSSNKTPELPPNQTEYVAPATYSKYKTGELVPPSVTDNTTRHLEMDSEGETMNLPKSNL